MAKNDLASVSQEVGLAFPNGARLVGVDREDGDGLVEFKVAMTEAEWAQFASTSPVPVDSMAPSSGKQIGPDHGWWDPGKAPGLRAGQTERPGARYLHIAFARLGDGTVAVYVRDHGT